MKFLQLILWPEGAYTDTAHTAKARIMIPYSHEIMNHVYIGSLGCIPNEPKLHFCLVFHELLLLTTCNLVTKYALSLQRMDTKLNTD